MTEMRLYGKGSQSKRAFTLVEVMLATVILVMILGIIFGVTQQTSNAWKNSSAKIESFQAARSAFGSMTQCISQATLNSYWGYDDTAKPTQYLRKSELHFISGKSLLNAKIHQVTHSIFFQAPLGYSDNVFVGLDSALNSCGFFIEYNKDPSRPAFLSELSHSTPDRYRYRLMQWVQPTQKMTVYQTASGLNPNNWFLSPLSQPTPAVHAIAENIVALVILPKSSIKKVSYAEKDPLAPDYEYDSRRSSSNDPILSTQNRLPPLVEVVMVAVDEASFLKIGNQQNPPNFGLSQLFQRTSELEKDLQKLQEVLDAKPGNIVGNKVRMISRIFRADIPIWSSK